MVLPKTSPKIHPTLSSQYFGLCLLGADVQVFLNNKNTMKCALVRSAHFRQHGICTLYDLTATIVGVANSGCFDDGARSQYGS